MDKSKIINKTFNIIIYLISHIRTSFWRLFLKKIGKRVDIMSGVVIMSPQKVEIGHDVLLNADSKIGGQTGVKIGNYVQLAYNVNITSVNHSYQNPKLPIKKQRSFGGPVIIEDDVWIGANSMILPNIKIGRGAIVGANAVVTKNVKPYSIVGGVPARFIKFRFSKKEIQRAKKVDLS